MSSSKQSTPPAQQPTLEQRLGKLGLTVSGHGETLRAELQVTSLLVNPLSGKALGRVRFGVSRDWLRISEPPELVGTPGVALSQLQSADDLEVAVTRAYEEQLFHLQRRSAELQTLGLSPKVEPDTLELSVEVDAAPYAFTLVSDRRGQFRVGKARRDGEALAVGSAPTFELSEFREAGSLAAYLSALFGETSTRAPASQAEAPGSWVSFGEVAERFGAQALLPPRSALEVLLELRVGEVAYRFAAVRLAGRTFRGLLAGPSGKLWAGRFDLGEFRGVASLASEVLGVPPEAVEVRPFSPGPGVGG